MPNHKYDVKFYIILPCIYFFSMAVLWMIYYIDFINMINNGYTNKNAIHFTMHSLERPLAKVPERFILFQYNNNSPELKTVWLNGNVKLPPLRLHTPIDIAHHTENIAIAGSNANLNNIPPDYKVVGNFDTPDSYRLNSEIWLIPAAFELNLNQGTFFLFNTPHKVENRILSKLLNSNSIEKINAEDYGSYALNSNKTVLAGLWISLVFLMIAFILTSMIWVTKEKNYVRIMYMHGVVYYKIYAEIVLRKLLPCLLCLFIGILPAKITQNFIYPLWDPGWILHSFLIWVGMALFLLMASFKVVISASIGKRSKQY